HHPVEGAAHPRRIYSDFSVGRSDLRYLHGRVVSSPVPDLAINKCSRRNHYSGSDSLGAIVDRPAGTGIDAYRLDDCRATQISIDDSRSRVAHSWGDLSSIFAPDMAVGR